MSPAGADTTAWRNPLRDKRDKRMPRIAGPCAVVIFGVTGDLARKKLMPAIYDLANRGLLPPSFALVGFARRDWADEDFGKIVFDAVKQHARTPFRQEVWDRLAEGFRFVQGTFDDDASFERLKDTLHKLDVERGTSGNHAFYLSIPPKAFPQVCEQLSKSGLADKPEGSWSRVVIEKPFGHDLKSAEELNAVVNSVFPESSVFRIDHYLGKETVQNLLALRFANEMFEPVLNSHYVDSVQITMAEDIGLGGRGGYYDGVGAARDVIQNHLLQLLALTAMEEPVSFSPQSCRPKRSRCSRRPGSPSRWTRPPPAGSTRPAGRAARRSSDCSTRRASRRPPPPRPSPPSPWMWTPGAGPACRSICAPENAWAAGSPRSRCCSSVRHTCPSMPR